MSTITINADKAVGVIKPMHAVNNGPVRTTRKTQLRENFNAYKAAKIPFARNHDASTSPVYGGPVTVDVHYIFPDFSKDVNDPASYDFINTDVCVKDTFDAGTEVFYRLGSKIEHTKGKYGTKVPADFQKWADICEHIIMHYTEGWAEGFHYSIRYWEIWNEPNLDADDAPNKRNWQGTAAQFFDLYKTAATHLKKRFPNLKIGGPASALTGKTSEWLENFFTYLTTGERVPMDFFSWHIYAKRPADVSYWSKAYRALLDKYGYRDTESILDEWNYANDWGIGYVDSIRDLQGIKGAAFSAATMCQSQNDPVDMLMYYDARPCLFNGLFDSLSLRPLPGYYNFVMFSQLYEAKNQIFASSDDEQVYVVSAKDADGGVLAMIAYYEFEDGQPNKEITVSVNGAQDKEYYCYLVDQDHTFDLIGIKKASELAFDLIHQSILFLSQKPVELPIPFRSVGDVIHGFNI